MLFLHPRFHFQKSEDEINEIEYHVWSRMLTLYIDFLLENPSKHIGVVGWCVPWRSFFIF